MSEKKNLPGKELIVKESSATNNTEDIELARLRRDVFRSDREKFALFTKMLRTNALYKKAKISHKYVCMDVLDEDLFNFWSYEHIA